MRQHAARSWDGFPTWATLGFKSRHSQINRPCPVEAPCFGHTLPHSPRDGADRGHVAGSFTSSKGFSFQQSPTTGATAATKGLALRWLSAPEATRYLRLPSVRALYQAVRRGWVPAHRFGPRQLPRKKRIPTKEQALAVAAKSRTESFEGSFLGRRRLPRHTVAELWKSYAPAAERDNDSWETDKVG